MMILYHSSGSVFTVRQHTTMHAASQFSRVDFQAQRRIRNSYGIQAITLLVLKTPKLIYALVKRQPKRYDISLTPNLQFLV